MCGILASFQRKQTSPISEDAFHRMLGTLRSRGPDEQTVYSHGPARLGHTRLSIIDLHTGTQPLFNEDKSVACILNGEIYNFKSLRDQLVAKGHTFKTQSDTEVLVHLYEERGEAFFEDLTGMFGIVLYDLKAKKMLVGRDRTGEKPVYFYDSPSQFLCASELKALLAWPQLDRQLDPEAIAAYLSSLYVPAPLSIYKTVKKLKPGHFLRVTEAGTEDVTYWAPRIAIRSHETEQDIVEGIRSKLSESIKNKLEADVPLGVFLSGGLDSSAVVAFMAKNTDRRIKTYSVGFGSDLSELPYAKQVADQYGTEHTELTVQPHIKEELDAIVAYYDEPFADTSNVPTYLISREARKHVKVVLTGDGGDELFAGYGQYLEQKYYTSSSFKRKLIKLIDRLVPSVPMDAFYPHGTGGGGSPRVERKPHLLF